VYSGTVPVGVVIASQFQSKCADVPMRMVQDRSIVRISLREYLMFVGRKERQQHLDKTQHQDRV
jgi:hypothetical protein